ncbi:hypothetical protein GYA19_00160 [Candidatus Beckwithbacteria bacterium]|nr:hypothetical protein [Candidatus Beckwithbacteria bacterium]
MKNNQINFFKSLAAELFKIRYPQKREKDKLILNKLEKQITKKGKANIKFKNPLPEKNVFYELTTARNRNLITQKEQGKLQKTVVGFFGMSVGSHAALTWMMESRADLIKIADPDTIDSSNLNRLRFGWDVVGQYKIDVVKKLLSEINPYAKIVKTSVVDDQTIEALLIKNKKVNIIVDAIDDLKGKIFLRKLCKDYKLPLISAADVGDNVVVDIERYDLDPDYSFFHNRIPEIEKINLETINPLEKKNLIIKLVGFEHNSEKMLNSLMSIGKTIPTWPQLGATATIAGGVVTTLIKKIVLGEKVLSGRYYLSLDDLFVQDYNSKSRQLGRKKLIKTINQD